MTTTAFLGAYQWRDQRAPEYAAPNIAPSAYYQRFTIAQIQAGELVTWLKTVPAGAVIGIRIQELVPGSVALPANHGVPGAYDSGFKAFVPDYNSREWFALIRATLQTVVTQIRGYLLLRVDMSFGKWAEGHLYQLLAALAHLRPTDESLRALLAIYRELFDLAVLHAPIGNDVLLGGLYAAGGRGVACDSWGLIDNDGRDRAEEFWKNAERAAILNDPTVRIVGETGSSNPAKLNFPWIEASFRRHVNVVAFGNGNIPFGALPAISQQVFARCLGIVAARRLALLQTPPPPPPSEVAVLQAELAAARAELTKTRAELVQTQADFTAYQATAQEQQALAHKQHEELIRAENRFSTLANAAQRLVIANAHAHTALNQIEALTAVPS